MLGVKAASANDSNLWGISFPSRSDKDIMSRLSKEGKLIHPTEDKMEKELIKAKYAIFEDMVDTQTRYRNQIDDALSKVLENS